MYVGARSPHSSSKSKRLETQYGQIEKRTETMYVDKLDERINQEVFDKHAAILRCEQERLQRKIKDIQKATPAPIGQAVDMLRLTSRASEVFLQQPAAEQRRLLQVVAGRSVADDSVLTF